MASYSKEFKEQIVRKMMPPNSQSVARISRESGVPNQTLYAWRKQYQDKGFVMPAKNASPNKWDAKTRLAAIIQTAAMNEAERAEYCRKNGLYTEQLDEWKAAFEGMTESPKAGSSKDVAAERKKVKSLEKELLRKERALAETAALLTLSKKAQAIWGSSEDD